MGKFEDDLKKSLTKSSEFAKSENAKNNEFERKTAISRKIKIFVKKYCI